MGAIGRNIIAVAAATLILVGLLLGVVARWGDTPPPEDCPMHLPGDPTALC